MEKYLYFRTQATDADDDDAAQSGCWPTSSLMGMGPTSDTALILYFTPMLRRTPSGNEPDADGQFDNHDSVTVTISANTHLVAMQKIIQAINGPSTTGLIIIANDDSGGTNYLKNSGITSCGTITVQAAYTN